MLAPPCVGAASGQKNENTFYAINGGCTLPKDLSKRCRAGEIRQFWQFCSHAGRYNNRQKELVGRVEHKAHTFHSPSQSNLIQWIITMKMALLFNSINNATVVVYLYFGADKYS